MRLFLLTLMIALLPLRGWMGDAMTLERSVSEHDAMTVASVQDNCHQISQHGMHEAATTSDPAHAQDDGDSCTDCQICHSIALATTLLSTPTLQARMPQPLVLNRLHASADPAPGFKPPIASV